MAREIDFNNLTEEDYPYLQARTGLVKEAELQGFKGIREEVDAWKAPEVEYDANQDVRVPPQTEDPSVNLTQESLTPGANGEEEEVEEIDYASASKDQLIAEAKERGLATSGTKDELIARLEANDEEEEEDEEPQA